MTGKKTFFIYFFFCFIFIFGLKSCGIEEYYYLPQAPGSIPQLLTGAKITVPSISSFYYATDYKIFYRIYLSDKDTVSEVNFNQAYVSDINYFNSYTEPSNTSSIPSINTFSGRSYYELKNSIGQNGGDLEFIFPSNADFPTITINGGTPVNLERSDEVFIPTGQGHESFFRNTTGLNEGTDNTSRRNADVAPITQGQGHAYTVMYIVAAGSHPTNFQPIYSKPRLINVFRLPNN